MVDDVFIDTTVSVTQTATNISFTATFSGVDDTWILSFGDFRDKYSWKDYKIWID